MNRLLEKTTYKTMKDKLHMQFTSLFTAVSTVALSGTALAQTAPTTLDWLKVSGYGSLSYVYDDKVGETFADGGSVGGGRPRDSVLVRFDASEGALGARASLYYAPGVNDDDAGFLDYYLTYKTGAVTITAGNYLSYLGYEAFHADKMSQISYAGTVGGIPAYHSGVKVDYATDTFVTGLNVSDSLNGDRKFWRGDEDFSDDLGYEAYFKYIGVENLTVFAGIGYESTEGAVSDFITYDLWASYNVTDKLTIAGELYYHDNGQTTDKRGIQGIAFLKYAFTDKISTALRYGHSEYGNGGMDDHHSTISPAYAVNDHLLLRAELSYSSSTEATLSGIQAIATF
jgi:hypothetical protein